MHRNPVYRITTKVLFAPIILYGLYVQFHADFGPGGGFQAGVIVAAAFILYAIVFGLKDAKRIHALTALGVLLYSGVGVANILLGGNYLEYGTLAPVFADGQHRGILLVELGVGITVTSVMLALFYAFAGYAGRGRRRRG